MVIVMIMANIFVMITTTIFRMVTITIMVLIHITCVVVHDFIKLHVKEYELFDDVGNDDHDDACMEDPVDVQESSSR